MYAFRYHSSSIIIKSNEQTPVYFQILFLDYYRYYIYTHPFVRQSNNHRIIHRVQPLSSKLDIQSNFTIRTDCNFRTSRVFRASLSIIHSTPTPAIDRRRQNGSTRYFPPSPVNNFAFAAFQSNLASPSPPRPSTDRSFKYFLEGNIALK